MPCSGCRIAESIWMAIYLLNLIQRVSSYILIYIFKKNGKQKRNPTAVLYQHFQYLY